MINTILFGSDFSEEADEAFEYAITIAHKMEASVTLYHSIEEMYDFATRSQRIIDKEIEEISKRFENQIKEIRKQPKYRDIHLDYKIDVGRTVANIEKAASEVGADLIVMGYQNNEEDSGSLKRMLYGNITSEVILTSDVPVLAVPSGSKEHDFKNMIFASDYNATELEIIESLVALAEEFSSSIEIVHVDEEETKEAQKAFQAFREKVNTSVTNFHFVYTHLTGKDFAKEISEYSQSKNADLIVMGRKKRSFLRYIFSMGEAKELTFCKSAPLLVIPVKE